MKNALNIDVSVCSGFEDEETTFVNILYPISRKKLTTFGCSSANEKKKKPLWNFRLLS